ncbi:MAG: hypothetical protein WCP46_00290 [Alphaproteobacteria bacterium]
MIKGQERKESTFVQELFTGFELVKVIAVNPTRKELDSILDITDREKEADEIDYVGETKDGDARVRLCFVLEKQDGSIAYHNISLIDKVRLNKDETKHQVINSTCSTSWSNDEGTFPEWFTNFTERKTNKLLGPKTWRKALVGEEELAVFLRTWQGRLDWNQPGTEVTIDTKRLFRGNYKEFRELVDSDYATSFVALFGVRNVEKTNDAGETEVKQYQSIWSKAFLGKEFYKGAISGSFSNDYQAKTFKKFKEGLDGEYGFKATYTLGKLVPYEPTADISATTATKAEISTAGDDY